MELREPTRDRAQTDQLAQQLLTRLREGAEISPELLEQLAAITARQLRDKKEAAPVREKFDQRAYLEALNAYVREGRTGAARAGQRAHRFQGQDARLEDVIDVGIGHVLRSLITQDAQRRTTWNPNLTTEYLARGVAFLGETSRSGTRFLFTQQTELAHKLLLIIRAFLRQHLPNIRERDSFGDWVELSHYAFQCETLDESVFVGDIGGALQERDPGRLVQLRQRYVDWVLRKMQK